MVAKSRRKTKRKPVPKGYDSRLEYDLHKKELKHWEYHPQERIEYVTPSTYEPDFVLETCSNKDCTDPQHRCCEGSKTILLEVKGRFRDRKEASKYIHIREALKQKAGTVPSEEQEEEPVKEIIFLFQDADKPMPFAGKRKDGTKQTHGEWAEKNGFKYACVKRGLDKTWLTDLM